MHVPGVESPWRIAAVPLLVLAHGVLEGATLLRELVLPALLGALDEDVDRVPSARVHEQEAVRMKGVGGLRLELRLGEHARRGGLLEVVPVLDAQGGGGGDPVQQLARLADDRKKRDGDGTGGDLATEEVPKQAQHEEEEEAGGAEETEEGSAGAGRGQRRATASLRLATDVHRRRQVTISFWNLVRPTSLIFR